MSHSINPTENELAIRDLITESISRRGIFDVHDIAHRISEAGYLKATLPASSLEGLFDEVERAKNELEAVMKRINHMLSRTTA